MKVMSNAVLRSISAIVLGLVLMFWPGVAISYLVIFVGILFIFPGILSIVNYIARKGNNSGSKKSSMFPIDGLGSFLLGLWMVINPAFFVSILMYVLGALFILAGIFQIAALSGARKYNQVPGVLFVIPVFILISGMVIIVNPFGAVATAFIFLGGVSLFYGVTELLGWYKFKKGDSIQ